MHPSQEVVLVVLIVRTIVKLLLEPVQDNMALCLRALVIVPLKVQFPLELQELHLEIQLLVEHITLVQS